MEGEKENVANGGKVKLNVKDKKILFELDKNCRQTNAQIAKVVGLSKEGVAYRIDKLEEQGVITQYQAVVNLSKLGVIAFKIYLSFQYLTSDKLKSIIEKLKSKKEAKWIVSTKGSWDMIITLETDSLQKVDRLKDEIFSLFGKHIREKTLTIHIGAENYSRNYLSNLNNRQSREIYGEYKKIEIDDIDLRIIGKLSENARRSIVDLAEELKTTPRIVDYRIKQLIKNKIITGFKIALGYDKLGIQFYKVFLSLDNPKVEEIKKLIGYFESNKNIIHHVKVLGNWDLEPEFEVYSEQEFDAILQDIKDKFSDVIKKAEIITISKEHKFVYF